MFARSRILILLCMIALAPRTAIAQIVPNYLYSGVNRPIPVAVSFPIVDPGDSAPPDANRPLTVSPPAPPDGAVGGEIRLIDPDSGVIVASSPVTAGDHDLAALFPVIWTGSAPVVYAQLYRDGVSIGAPLIIQRLTTPPVANDRLTATVRDAAAADAQPLLRQLLSFSADFRRSLREEVHVEPASSPTLTGVRTWVDQHIILRTTLGDLTLQLRPDAAPNTSWHILELARGGFYRDTSVHRVVATDGRGLPFVIQLGDPTGTGRGDPGFFADFEPSSLRHDFAVVSMARRTTDPNTGGSQFMICLSRAGCAEFDGAYTAFGEIVGGAQTLAQIETTPVGVRDTENPTSPKDRPLDPPRITEVLVVDAPPIGKRPGRISRVEAPAVER